MPIVVNTNSSAVSASFNLSRAMTLYGRALKDSPPVSELMEPVTMPVDGRSPQTGIAGKQDQCDDSEHTEWTLSPVQDGAMETIGKVVNRMAELRVMADDVTKNSGDIENYPKEFIELQIHMKHRNSMV